MKNLFPLVLFLILYITTGIYFTLKNTQYAFYQISPVVILIPSIILAIILAGKNGIDKFISAIANKEILSMIIIFLLAGAFTNTSKSIGGIESLVNLILKISHPQFIICSLFIVSSILGTFLGTSMGVIAAITPIAIEIANQIQSHEILCIATVIGGAMLGDNLSLISDTTIAAIKTQGSSLIKKLKLNVIVSGIAGIITILILMLYNVESEITIKEYSIISIIPYFIVIILALLKYHVFIVLISGILSTGIIGLLFIEEYGIIIYAKSINKGFISVNEVVLLSLFITGIIYMVKVDHLSSMLLNYLSKINLLNKKISKLIIGLLASISDIIVANNTIAILVSGGIVKNIAEKNKIKPHDSAFLIDSFSCAFQGIIPHGAQIILASSLSGINPLAISSKVFFCYVVIVVLLIYVSLSKKN